MTRHPYFGIWLAMFGTLILTPDSLFLRLSEMSGVQMAAWRGMFMGAVLIPGWAIHSRVRRADLKQLTTRYGVALVVCQFFNSLLFCLGIAAAPVAMVLLGLAAVPVFSAVFSWLMIGETTRPATWLAIAAVIIGLGIAVSGGNEASALGLDLPALLGALAGLSIAVVLALNFVIVRSRPSLPVPLAIGCGALLSGAVCAVITGPEAMAEGRIWAVAVTGLLIVPVSFMSMSIAARHTNATNVSLLLLLETVLAPIWIWLVIDEAPTGRMLFGGGIVILSLLIYLMTSRRRAPSMNRL